MQYLDQTGPKDTPTQPPRSKNPSGSGSNAVTSKNPSGGGGNSRKPSTRTPASGKKPVSSESAPKSASSGGGKDGGKSNKKAGEGSGSVSQSATTIKTQAVVNMVSSGTLKSEISVSADSLGSSRSTKKSFSGTNMHSSLGYLP